jgi:hypothetical protein
MPRGEGGTVAEEFFWGGGEGGDTSPRNCTWQQISFCDDAERMGKGALLERGFLWCVWGVTLTRTCTCTWQQVVRIM